jgi:hypothetical protein
MIEAYASRQAAQVSDLHWNVTGDLALVEAASLLPREIASRPEVTWSTTETGKLGDEIEVALYWRDVSWVAHVPPAREGRVQLPTLPGGADRFAPWPDDEVIVDGVTMTDDLFLESRVGVFEASYARSENYNQVTCIP